MQHERADYTERIQDLASLIPDDEPVFLIRGQDAVAQDTLMAYATYNERAGGSKLVSDRVRAHAARMKAWPHKKLADATSDTHPHPNEPTTKPPRKRTTTKKQTMHVKITPADQKVLHCLHKNGPSPSVFLGQQLWHKSHIPPHYRTGNATRALQRLEQKGLVMNYQGDDHPPGSYCLTPKGLAALSSDQ